MTYPFDTMRDSFLRFMAEGASYREALELFDLAEFRAAAMAELDGDLVRRVSPMEDILRAGDFVTNDSRGLPALLELLVHAQIEQGQQPCAQCLDLWAAGWTSEVPNPKYGPCQSMSLYWRAPSKRPGKLGRRYLSTNQAWNALQTSK